MSAEELYAASQRAAALPAEVDRLAAERDDALAALHVEWQAHSAVVAKVANMADEMADEIDLLRVQLDITTRLLREVWAYGNMSPLDGGTMNRIGNYLGLNE